ncbi:MAG TPA: hypothetical protein VN032_02070 [Thermoanaerobaculia bacterium]|jgi:hypothetical protein|nr:hypothetical protein [Thermoanaerobaculia bacterium]
MLPSVMARKHLAGAALFALGAGLLQAATDLLPQRISEVSRQVEEVRGRRFERPVPATEIDPAEARRILRSKILEGLPASAEEYLHSLAILGLIEDGPGSLDRLVDFYASQVVAFYDPEPRRFFVVKGAEGLVAASADMAGVAQNLIYSHELMHALQDESMRLDSRTRALKDNSDRGFALQCLLEGEATFVMIRVALKDIPGADAQAEEELGPLLTSGGLERANVPKDIPAYFVDQLFFPYSEGTEFVRAAIKKGGWPEVDRLWRDPPDSSSEILHGAPYPPPVEGLLPANAAALFPGQRLVYMDTLGEWTMRFLLGRALPDDEAAKAATGWRGDRIAFVSSGGRMGYLWRIRFEDGLSAARFEAALRKARATRPLPSPETIQRNGRDIVLATGLAKVPELP